MVNDNKIRIEIMIDSNNRVYNFGHHRLVRGAENSYKIYKTNEPVDVENLAPISRDKLREGIVVWDGEQYIWHNDLVNQDDLDYLVANIQAKRDLCAQALELEPELPFEWGDNYE